jgi:hypothetical protein
MKPPAKKTKNDIPILKGKPKYVREAAGIDVRGYEVKKDKDPTKFNSLDSCPDCGADPIPEVPHECSYRKYYNADGSKKPLPK